MLKGRCAWKKIRNAMHVTPYTWNIPFCAVTPQILTTPTRRQAMDAEGETMTFRSETMSASLEAITKLEQAMIPPMETTTARYEAKAWVWKQ
jgi:hypothetical protein